MTVYDVYDFANHNISALYFNTEFSHMCQKYSIIETFMSDCHLILHFYFVNPNRSCLCFHSLIYCFTVSIIMNAEKKTQHSQRLVSIIKHQGAH